MLEMWQGTLFSVGGALLVALIGHALHLSNKFAVMESQVQDLKARGQDTEEHGNRITALESAITDIRNLTSALQIVPISLGRVETLLQSQGLRLSTIEAHLFNLPRFRVIEKDTQEDK